MLNSLIIRNFRIFKELKINRVNRVNLFVGKNNSGKSCLLEALQIYAAKGNSVDLYKIVLSRDEDWESLLAEKRKNSIRKISAPLGYLFNGYMLPDINGKAIEIGPCDSEADLLKIRHRAFHITEDEEGRRIRTPVEQESTEDDFIDIQTALEVTQGEKRLYYIPLEYNRYSSSMRKREFNHINFQVVPTRQINDSNISALWDNINLTDLEQEIVSALKIIDPNILAVALIGDISNDRFNSRKNKRIPIVRYKGIKERIPLKTMGDGLLRLFHVILALVNAKDGLLLIDEFENGLYWALHPKLWDIILRLSHQLNVQVIATTHSRDCIKGFYEVWKNKKEDASFYRLEADAETGAKVINYTYDMLSDAIETDIEVR